jgi:putative endonuclease
MKHFVYMLRCADDSLYTGYTTNLEQRIAEHNGEGETKKARSAGARYTRPRRPVVLVYFETFKTRSEAMQREYAIKQLTRIEKQALVAVRTKTIQ